MKYYPLIKVAAFSAILLTAMAFSCQDHHVPDPDPISNCNRVDGTPRAFSCEFQITRIEIFDRNTSNFAEVITPQRLSGGLYFSQASQTAPLSGQAYYLSYKVRVHAKRIANSQMPAWNYYQLVVLGSGGLVLMPDNVVDPIPLGNSISDYQQISNWAVGETKTFDGYASFLAGKTPVISSTTLFVGVRNYNSYDLLISPPHNYERLRDLAEGALAFNIQMKDG
jgi:hypothetical protein